MSEQKLPEQLLREMLAYIFAIPHDVFCQFPTHAPWTYQKQAGYEESCHNILLVSKRWLRVGSPLLYESVSLRTPIHAQTVAKLFKHNPGLGRAVQKLKLLGVHGRGRDLPTIIESTPNLHTVYLSMSVTSYDSIAGIKQALPILNPTRLYIEERPLRTSKRSSELRDLLAANLGKWASLRYIHYAPSCNLEPMLLALKEAPALEELWVDSMSIWTITGDSDLELREVLAKPSMRKVHCLGRGHRVLQRTLVKLQYPDAMRKLITYDDAHELSE